MSRPSRSTGHLATTSTPRSFARSVTRTRRSTPTPPAVRSCSARRASTSARGRTSAPLPTRPMSRAPCIARLCGCSRRRRPWSPRCKGPRSAAASALALSADFRVASAGSRFSANFARLGFHHGFGLSVTLPTLAGQQTALDLLLTGRRVPGEEAFGARALRSPRATTARSGRRRARARVGARPQRAAGGSLDPRHVARRPGSSGLEAALKREASEQDRLRGDRGLPRGHRRLAATEGAAVRGQVEPDRGRTVGGWLR